MCGDCLKVHRKLKIARDHSILSMEELECNPENVMKLAEGFTCSEHRGEDIKYYCKDHKLPCCGTCFFDGHKICSKVIDLKKELPALLCENKPVDILADMNKLESHLKKFIEMNEFSVTNLEIQVSRLTTEIRKVRQEINDVLDELEKRVNTEGNIIYKEEVIRTQEENHQCLSLIHAVRNSHFLLEAAHTYGSNLQKFLMAEKMKSQLHSYYNLVEEKFEKTQEITLEVQLGSPIKSILSLSLSEIGKVVATTSANTLSLICSSRPLKGCHLQQVNVVGLNVPTYIKKPNYSGVTFLPGDRVRLMLTEFNNNQCILLSSTYQFITNYTLTNEPWNMCVLDDQEVAVSFSDENKIQILSVIGDTIRPIRVITTSYHCNGIAAAGKGEMVVTAYCGNNKSQWSLINTRGEVKCTHQYDCSDSYFIYIALNNMKTQVFVSVCDLSSLRCFGMDGKKLFTYSPDNLRGIIGIAVDGYDNIYILGKDSNNLHQLSRDGSVQQVLNTGVPRYPMAICIHKSMAILMIMNGSDERAKLYIYQLK